MDNFQIETAQNINIHQNVAPISDRVFAFFIDGLIMFIYVMLIFIAIAGLGIEFELSIVFSITIGLPLFLYHLLWETFWDGRSPGKAVLKIRVVNLDGSKPAFSNFLLRWLIRMVDITFSSGSVAVITLLFNGKGQRLGDIAAKTTVISEKQKITFSQTLLVDVPEGYVPKYPQVTLFKDQEIEKIKQIFKNAKAKNNHQIILRLSKKIAGLMEVTPQEKPFDFIDVVIKDYNYYSQKNY